jgi:hypothetical protein
MKNHVAGIVLLALLASLMPGAIPAQSALTPETRAEIDAILEDRSAKFDESALPALLEKYENAAVAPYLADLVSNYERPVDARLRAMLWLGKTKDRRTVIALMPLIKRYAAPPAGELSRDEAKLFRASLLSLGMCGDDQALDLLFQMTDSAYWTDKRVSAPAQFASRQQFIESMRDTALQGIALSGTPRAISAFETGEGIPADKRSRMPALLETAIQRSQGVINDPATL